MNAPLKKTSDSNESIGAPNRSIGAKLKALRKADGLKLAVVAKNVGTTVATLSAIETSRIENPGYKQVTALANYYGVTVEELADGESSKRVVSNSLV